MALSWADSLLAGGAAPTAEVEADLRRHFTDAQIMELTYAMGSFIGFSKQLIMLGLEPTEMPILHTPIPGSNS
ncbi:MAG: hypothetical protein ACRBK7_30760 [Acidimicrobiales bacterium]